MKIKTKFLLSFIISMLATVVYSQNTTQKQPLPLVTYDANVDAPLTQKELSQIVEVYGEQAHAQILNKPQRLKDVKNILRNRIILKKVKAGSKEKNYPLLSSVPLFDVYVKDLHRDKVFNLENFNPLKYEFNFHSRNSFVFEIDNSGYYLIIKSQHQ